MRRPDIVVKPVDDGTLKRETGRDRAGWMALIDASGAQGRAAIGKVLQAEKLDAWWATVVLVENEARTGLVEKDGKPKGYSICSTKTVAVSAERAFNAFTIQSDLNAWFGAGETIQPVKSRPAKALTFVWTGHDFAEGSAVEVLFQPRGDKCGLVVNHTRIATRDDADAVRAAWEGSLNRLKQRLEL